MKKHINYYFLTLAVILIVFGILFLATLSAPISLKTFGNTNYYLLHQLFAMGIGMIGLLIAFKMPLHILKKMSLGLLIVNIILLSLVFLPHVGTKFWGAKRWVSIGNNSFQPSEFLKISSILYLAALISSRFSGNAKKSWNPFNKNNYNNVLHVFLPFLLLLGIIGIILIFQKDVSTLGVVVATLLVMYFTSGTPLWNTVATLSIFVLLVGMLIVFEPYRIQRFTTFLNPESDPLGQGFQLRQSLIAFGSGGIFGKGLGLSTQKFGFLPAAMSDSIFAIMGEEMGLIGCTILIALFVGFFWLGAKIVKSSHDNFAKLTAIGIVTWIIVQTFLNIGSAMGLFPVSGVPMPFFSYGGSHIIAELIGVGLLLNISKSS